jgi:integrase
MNNLPTNGSEVAVAVKVLSKRTSGSPRSLRVEDWPLADRLAWAEACRPAIRLKRGGSAAHLAEVSQKDIANRYGLYLDFLERAVRLDRNAGAPQLVTAPNVEEYLMELKARVSSVTVWNSIYKLRRAAQLISPTTDFSWLAEIEKDVALVMRPRDKAERLVLSDRLVEAGLTLIQEAEMFGRTPMQRAIGVRNGLMIALYALHPLRIKNFASLRIGKTIKRINGHWWLVIRTKDTKGRRLDERRIPDFMAGIVDRYVDEYRPILIGNNTAEMAFWISSTTKRQFTIKNMGILISRITAKAVGVDVSPHLFRMAAASTAAIYGTATPHLGAAVLGHRDERVTEEHYNRAGSLHAGTTLAGIVANYRS